MSQISIIPIIKTLDKSIDLAQEYDASFEYNDFYSSDTLDNKQKTDELISIYKGTGRNLSNDTLHGAFLDITIHSSDRLIRQVSEYRIEQSLDIASRLECKGVVFHTNLLANFNIPSYINNFINVNKLFFSKMCGKYPHLNIYLENMFETEPDTLSMLAKEMCSSTNWGVCLDVSHAHLSKLPMNYWFDKLLPYIKHIHINDNNQLSDSHDVIGTGNIDWNLFTSILSSSSPDATILVEVSSIEKQVLSLQYMKEHHVYPFL